MSMADFAMFVSLLLLLTVGATDASAQTQTQAQTQAQTQESDSLFRQFEARFATLDSIIHHPARHAPAHLLDNDGIDRHFTAYDHRIDSMVDVATQSRISAMRSETGLTINGQTYARLDDGFGLDEDDALSRYKAKLQAEVRWHFLQSSVINRGGKAHEIRLKGDIERMRYHHENLDRLVALQKEQFKQHYDSLLCGVVKHRIENLELLRRSLHYLLLQGSISSDELLTTINEKAEAERILATIDRDYPATPDISNPNGIIVEVDTCRLLDYIRNNGTRADLLELQRVLLLQQAKNASYWSTLNVAPFVRFSYYMRPDIDNSSNIDAGISFIVPLSHEMSKKRKALLREAEVVDFAKEREVSLISDEIYLTILNIERMNRSIEGEVDRLADLKGYLLMRLEAYKNRIGEYNYLSRMKEYNSYLLCCERLLAFSYQRDCLLASLQSFLPDTSILDFCRETEISAESVATIKPYQP